MMWETQKEEDLENYYKRKYADDLAATRHYGEGGEQMSEEIQQQTLLPGVKDPNLWMVSGPKFIIFNDLYN